MNVNYKILVNFNFSQATHNIIILLSNNYYHNMFYITWSYFIFYVKQDYCILYTYVK